MEQLLEYIKANYIQWLEVLAELILIVVLARLLTLFLKKVIRRSYARRMKKAEPERQQQMNTACSMLCSFVKYAVFLLAITAMMGAVGLTGAMNSLIAAAGVGGIALGIGAQSLIKDVAAGAFILFENQMHVGDHVSIGGKTGIVEEISLRNTTLVSPQQERFIVPNGSIDVLTNYSRAQYLVLVDASVAYEADIDLAKRLMCEEAEAYAAEHEHINVGEATVLELGDSGVKLRLTLYCYYAERITAERSVRERILRRFRQENVEIPYNKLVILDGNKA
ncbi:MAG: mechanosensitive ion channel family protein [Eubacteriales bacterium]|nr:mechanosensitive ion channel family protein [Eubacteriales bacterium]